MQSKTSSANSGNPASLPVIHIDLFQPGDRGSFVIRAVDTTHQKVICQNLLPEHISDVQYLYTARLLEQSGEALKPDTLKDDAWKKTDRYKDVTRYGQKLYHDLFGEKDDLRNYLRRANHLKGGVLYVLRLYNTATELWNIPWEYLHDGERFLGIDGRTNMVRTVPDIPLDANAQALAEIPYPLRILLFISAPKNAAPLNVDFEVQTILAALRPAIEAHQVELDIVEEGSLSNLDLNLSYEPYHVLYYTGHGTMTPQGSALVLEDEQGAADLINLNPLVQVLRKAGGLRLAILVACKSGQIDETRAASGIATGLMEVVPAVVAMQFSILDISGQVFARSFFQQIGQGATLEDAMQTARHALNQANPALTDWGVPALYVHKTGMRLVDPRRTPEQRPAPKTIQVAPLPRPAFFVGRRDEQRILRQRLPQFNCKVAYLWGMSGIGKSTLAARVLERPGRKEILDSALVIPCKQTSPNQVLAQMADWLAGPFPEAAQALRNPQLTPDRRVMAAAQVVQRRRMVLVFDRFDAYLAPSEDRDHWDLSTPALAAFFRALATASWSILTIFTSRYRWKLLNDLDGAQCEEIHLDPLAPVEVGMLVQGLEHLKRLEPKPLNELLGSVGGHPASIYELEAQAAKDADRLVANLSRAPKILAHGWGTTFMNDLIERMAPDEREALQRLAVLESAFWTDDVQFAAAVPTRLEAEQMICHWEALSMVHFRYHDPEDDTVCYEMSQLVRTFMLSGCSPDQLKELNRKAAALLERRFVVMAEMRWQAGIGPEPSGSDPYEKARQELRLVVKNASHQTIAIVIRRALSWRSHLMQIGEYEKAAQIVNDVWSPIARRYGEPDLARELLEETVKTTTGRSQYLAQSNLATFYLDDGKFDEALKMQEEAYRRALKDGDTNNAATMLSQQAAVYFRQGKADKAKKAADQARSLYKKAGDVVGEAGTLRQVAEYYRQKEDYTEALKLAQIGEILLRDRRDSGSLNALMSIIQLKGVIYRRTKNYQQAFECYRAVFNMAQSLGSLPMVGNALGEMGSLMRTTGSLGDAARFTLDAISIAEQLKDYSALATRLFSLALIYEMQGSASDALVQAERAVALAKVHNPGSVSNFNETIARLRKKR